MGGRLDATNVLAPVLTAITPIDFDHEAYLGHTIEAIAGEKAGILKAGVPAVFARQRPEASAVLEAHESKIYAVAVSRDGKRAASAGGNGEAFVWNLETNEQVARLEGHDDGAPRSATVE